MPHDPSLTDAELISLIDAITAEILTQLERSGSRAPYSESMAQDTLDDDQVNILVIITHIEKHLTSFMGMVKERLRERMNPVYIIHDEVRTVLEQHGVPSDKCHPLNELEGFILDLDRYSSILLATPLLHLLTRVLALEDEDPLVRLILRALMNDTRVIALSDAMIPDLPKLPEHTISFPSKFPLNTTVTQSQSQTMPEAVHERIEGFKKFGITVAPLAELDQWLGGNSLVVTERVITEKEILELHSGTVRELRVPKGTIITPLANDRARELGISIIRSV